MVLSNNMSGETEETLGIRSIDKRTRDKDMKSEILKHEAELIQCDVECQFNVSETFRLMRFSSAVSPTAYS